MLLLLAWAAGNLDAISYLGLGGVFTAMMTGNTVLLGLALGQGHVRAALRSVLALAGFAIGVALGAGIVDEPRRERDWPPAVTVALGVEAAIVAAFSLMWRLWPTERAGGVIYALIVLCAVAMGVQSAAVRRLGVPGIATTYITGTLTSLVADVVARVRHSAHAAADDEAAPARRWEHRIGLLAAVFGVYALGALTGTLLYPRVALAPAVPLAAVAAAIPLAARGGRR
jgi:uncharacterized membrane protein YoaK (UPF0700 family)